MTEPEPLQQIDRTYVRFRGRKLSYFSGCDYFRLSSHPTVLSAIQSGLKKYGLNVAASRLTSGNHILYAELEKSLTSFFGAESAVVVSTGYVTNLVATQALAGNFSHGLIDDATHPSLTDAARFLDCPLLRFKHRDVNDLERALRRCGKGARLLVMTDGMFARDGSVAPLDRYLSLLPKDAMILVDDAHAAGVLGRSGKGSPEECNVNRRRIIQTVTLSKAFGVYGGAVLGDRNLRKRILERSTLFIGSTPLPLPLASASITSIRLLKSDASLRRRLAANARYVKSALRQAGVSLPDEPGPIIPIPCTGSKAADALALRLLQAGIFPPFTKYPGAPANGYFRFVLSSEHSRQQLDKLLEVLKKSANITGS